MSRRRYDDDAPRSSSAGPFSWGFGLTCGVIAAITLVFVGIPLLICGGIVYVVHGSRENAARLASEARQEDKAKDEAARDATRGGVTLGHVSVAIETVSVGTVDLDDFGKGAKSAHPQLQVKLVITNQWPAKKVDYRGWATDDDDIFEPARPSLKDNHGNVYRATHFSVTSRPKGQVQFTEAIHPGKATNDLLVFEPPVAQAEYLLLTLPGKNVGEKGDIRFRIPASMWSR